MEGDQTMSMIQLLNGQTEIKMNDNDLVYIAEKHLGYEYGTEIKYLVVAYQESQDELTECENDLEKCKEEMDNYDNQLDRIDVKITNMLNSLVEDKETDQGYLSTALKEVLIMINHKY